MASEHGRQTLQREISEISADAEIEETKALVAGLRSSSPIQLKACPLPAVLLNPRHATIVASVLTDGAGPTGSDD
jgi:hypothetical protein